MRIKLNNNQKDELLKDIVGSGGFQNLMIKLQNNFNHENNELTINSQELLEKIIKYAYCYQQGGYQGRLKTILDLE